MVNLLAQAYMEMADWSRGYISENHRELGEIRGKIGKLNDEQRNRAAYRVHCLETENIDLMGEIEYDRRTAAELEELHRGRSGYLEPGDENINGQPARCGNQGEQFDSPA